MTKKNGSTFRNSCNALIVGHRYVDWVLLKILVSGTMAGLVYNIATQETKPYSNNILGSIFHDCIKSWFGRFKSNYGVMG